MKVKIVLFALLGTLALAGAAKASFTPHIHQGEAEERTVRFLHSEEAGWRYRSEGYVDCNGGRISNISWACRVGWTGSAGCSIGRVRITNEYRERGTIYYDAHFIGRRC